MSEGKASILGQLIKQTKPFKPRNIYEPIGVSRQLVNGYLKKYTEEGVLTRQGDFYVVTDLDQLIGYLVATKEPVTASRLVQTRLLKDIKVINDAIYQAISLRTLGINGNREIRDSLREEIDSSIQTLKNAKRYLSMTTIARNNAKHAIRKQTPEGIWDNFEPILAPFLVKDHFISEVNGVVEEYEE